MRFHSIEEATWFLSYEELHTMLDNMIMMQESKRERSLAYNHYDPSEHEYLLLTLKVWQQLNKIALRAGFKPCEPENGLLCWGKGR